MKSGLQLAIGLFALVTLLALGVGYVLEKAAINTPTRGVPAASEPARPGDSAKPGTIEPEYDRSDLVLSLG
jgi:hypothetical protein